MEGVLPQLKTVEFFKCCHVTMYSFHWKPHCIGTQHYSSFGFTPVTNGSQYSLGRQKLYSSARIYEGLLCYIMYDT